MRWYTTSVCLLILSALSVVIMRYLSTTFSDDPMMCYMLSVVLTGIAAVLYICSRTNRIKSLKGAWASICALAVISFASWILWGRAIHEAPNPGYVNAIVNANVILTVGMCTLLFGDHITMKSVVGSVVVVIGLSLVVT